MAWNFGRQPDPDPEKEKKLAEQSKAEMDAFTATLRSSFEESIKPLRTEFAELKARVEAPPVRQQTTTEKTEIPSVLDNEDAAFAARLGPVAVQTALLNARMTETEVLNEISGKGWGHLIPKVREVLEKQTPLQTKTGQGYRGYVENVADMLIGKEAKEKGLRFDGQKQTFFLEDASGSGGSNPKNAKLRQLDTEATDGRIDILNGRTVAEWAKNMGIENPEALIEGAN